MKARLMAVFSGLAMTSLLAAACSTEVESEEPGPTTGIVQQSEVSECGGFPDTMGSGDPGYCDAEVLSWSYDAATQKLTLVDERIELNCCGNHSSVLEARDGGYVLTQIDAPETYHGEPARCGCMCVFDYALIAEGIPEASMQLEIVRDVTDSAAGPQTVFSGVLDLSQLSGEEVVDTTPAMMCGETHAS